MALAMPLAFAVLGYGLIGFLVIVALIVLIVRMLRAFDTRWSPSTTMAS